MILVIQSFGKEIEYRRAIFAIWSYWVYCPKGKVLLFTDAPAFFKTFFSNQPIEYISLTPQKIEEMRGKIDFLHRMKIALIDEAFRLTNSNLLYIDSDTFFINDPTSLFNQVSEKKSLMHLNEYRFDSLSEMKLPGGKTFRAFLDLITTTKFTRSDGTGITVSPLQDSWNAGVIFLHHSHAQLLPDVYALTEQFYPPTQNHASEQYAFSVVLQNHTDIAACDSVIYHYWYRVKKKIMDEFLEKKLDEKWNLLSIDQKISSVKNGIRLLPKLFENHIWILRDNSIQAFNEKRIKPAFWFALRAVVKGPFDFRFLRDVMHHTRKLLLSGQ